jgi:hypothetical protein
MNDRTTLEIIAPTVEEALLQGLSQLGLTADAVSVEVVDSGSKGLFGLGGRQVRVRLTVNPPPLPGPSLLLPNWQSQRRRQRNPSRKPGRHPNLSPSPAALKRNPRLQ